MNLTQLPSQDPAQILRFRDRQFSAELIAVAILRFDFFTWLDGNGATSEAEICSHFRWAQRPADVLLTLCRASGFIETSAAGLTQLTTLGQEFLVAGSAHSLRPYYQPIADSPIVASYETILNTGRPGSWQADADGADWHDSMKDQAFAESFTELMNCRGITFGQQLALALQERVQNHQHVLDVGGGSGIYAATLVARSPHLRGTVLEQSPVDAIAEREIAKHGLADQIKVVSGDMFADPWPSDADIILLSNVLHDWDFPEVEKLLDRCADALKPGGLLVVHEAFIHDDKSGPLPVAEYSALLMNITQGKCYSVAEYADLLAQRGFTCTGLEPTIADRGFFTATKR
ncbi:Carminomycin 4-O-methyltransferase [Stieleria bergensis]|uniref:Carminomycin 4-O-methyltransferase n=1 Tax=Stieleria bergensis TaxID=2528025 RepID=A0A517SVR7_9BACT|nr:Carminomycin 4-O-methyltransferase [Planctomycetes bacterium SV_7m_r]